METLSLEEVLKTDYRPRGVASRLKWIVRRKIKNGEDPIPEIIGLELEKKRALECLISGRGIKLVGPYGCGKTTFAKSILELLREYHKYNETFIPQDCPVQEDALNIAYAAGLVKDVSGVRNVCPVCRKLYLDGNPKKRNVLRDVPVVKFEPTESKGFARVPPDAMPEDLVGSYNVRKLVEIGDPLDPEVFKHGKIGMASGGILFVNELGKLPERSQYTLLEASVEKRITPGKCRESFPVDFLLIADTNPEDEYNVNGAINDRLISIPILDVGKENEIRIVKKEANSNNSPYVPRCFFDLAVDVVRELREKEEFPYVGIRASIDAIKIAKASAELEGREVVNPCDLKEGLVVAVLGRCRYEDYEDSYEELSELVWEKFRDFKESSLQLYLRDIWADEEELLEKLEAVDWKNLKGLKKVLGKNLKRVEEVIGKFEGVELEEKVLEQVVGSYLQLLSLSSCEDELDK